MISQRAPATGQGVPPTACAPDLFTRLDELKGAAAAHAAYPVRWYLGFSTPNVDLQNLRPDGMVWRLANTIGAGRPPQNTFDKIKDLCAIIVIDIVWILGFLADVMVTAKLNLAGKLDPRLRDLSAEIAAKELTAKLSGSDPTWACAIDKAARDYFVPTETVSPGEAVSAYLADVIDEQGVDDYGRFSAVCSIATQINVQTGKQRPAPADAIELFFRGVIDKTTADDYFRQGGYLDAQYIQYQHDLHEYWPGPGEWIGWMKSAFTNDAVVNFLQLDRDFAAAYGDKQQKWANHDGYTDEQVKNHWRATYQWPDAMTAIDWYRRTVAGMLGGDDGITDSELQTIITHGSTPPAYQGAVYQSRWAPLSSRLLRTAFDLGVATEQQVLAALVVDGHSPADAQILLQEWQILKAEYTATRTGLPSVGKLYSMYIAFEIGTSDFQAGCQRRGLRDDEVQEALTGAHAERITAHRGEVIKIVKSEYMRGAVDEIAVNDVLLNLGLDGADVQEAVALWRYEFSVSPRPNAAGELAKSYRLGIINESEYVNSLTRLRYTPEQIARILAAEQIAEWSARLKDAEKIVSTTRKRLSADDKEWSKRIRQAEKWLAGVNRASKPNAGKLMSWVQAYVTGTPAKPLPHTPNPGLLYAPSQTVLAEQGAEVEQGPSGSTASGIAVAGAAPVQAAPAAGTANAPPAGAGASGTATTGANGSASAASQPGAGITTGQGSIDVTASPGSAGSPPAQPPPGS